MRNIICTLAIALIAGCGGSGGGGGQLPMDWEPTTPGLGIVESQQPINVGQPSLGELQAALATEFEKLGVDPDKVISSAPSGRGVEVVDLDAWNRYDPDTQELSYIVSWTERFAGDFDYNGEVNLSDLQLIALYWAWIQLASATNGLMPYST